MRKKEIFYVEDDKNMSTLIRKCLEEENYHVDHFDNGLVALQNFKSKSYDLCLLDVMLPGLDGFSIAQKIRSINSIIPIVIITARGNKSDKQYGFDLKIDDYITKPFDEEELLWKIEAILRRTTPQESLISTDLPLKIGSFAFDYQNFMLIHPSNERRLTPKEASLLHFLIINKNTIVKKEEILKRIWGDDNYFNSRSMDVFINRLRRYLHDDRTIEIETIPKIGITLKLRNNPL